VSRRDDSDRFAVVERDGQTFLIQCRAERPTSLLGPNSLGKVFRTGRDRLRWFVDVETNGNLLPVLKERFTSEEAARDRAGELRDGLASGTLDLGRRPALFWRRHHT
jgi:hypothetical protein